MTRMVKMVLTNSFAPDVRVYKEAKYLVEKGFDVEVLCWDRENEFVHKQTEVIDGIRVKRFFPYAKYGTGLWQIRAFFKFIRECKAYLQGKKYQYLHCHDLDGMIAGCFLRNKSTKLVFDMHEIYEVNGWLAKYRYLVRCIVRLLQNVSDFVIYVSQIQVTSMASKVRSKAVFLPNYPEIINYTTKKTPSDKLRISYIGGVRQYQELKNLMDACREFNDVVVSIHGSGVAADKLLSIQQEYANVQITGQYVFTESMRLYSECDLLYAVYPMTNLQNRVAIPVKFYEAVATMTPVIMSRAHVLEDFIKDKDIGFLVDGTDVGEIRSLVDFLRKNRSVIDDKRANLSLIHGNYSWDKVVHNLDQIY